MNRKKRKRPVVYYSRPNPKEQARYFNERESAYQEKIRALIERELNLDGDKRLIDDTLHEIRKINNQIKKCIDTLTKAISGVSIDNAEREKFIYNVLRTLEGDSSLLSIRMDAYDILFNPVSASNEMIIPICVYSKIEKVYKCLYPSRKSKGLGINMIGNSDKEFRLRNSIELAFFIILENAIKYSPCGESIQVSFSETSHCLFVVFQNWAICPHKDEIPKLTDRGYRSSVITERGGYTGNGLGLYLLKQICETNNVEYSISVKEQSKTFGNIVFNPFVVTLKFQN